MLSASRQWRGGRRDFEAARRLLRTKKIMEDPLKTISAAQFSDFSRRSSSAPCLERSAKALCARENNDPPGAT
jgi:hypothetical protein